MLDTRIWSENITHETSLGFERLRYDRFGAALADDTVSTLFAHGTSESRISMMINTASTRILHAIGEHHPIAVVGLFSGGHDSVTATAITHLAMQVVARSTPYRVVHINTGIGVPQTRQYVRELSAVAEWPLTEYRALENVNAKGQLDPQDYEALCLKYGFPGPHGHNLMYARLKERGLQRLERELSASARKGKERRVLYVTGCRSSESARRMGNTQEVQLQGRRIWVAPIHDWSKNDCGSAMSVLGIPANPVVLHLGKSGECLCGAFAKPGELDELAFWYPEVAKHIRELEGRVMQTFPWGWEEAPPMWWKQHQKGQMFMFEHLCWNCNKRRLA